MRTIRDGQALPVIHNDETTEGTVGMPDGELQPSFRFRTLHRAGRREALHAAERARNQIVAIGSFLRRSGRFSIGSFATGIAGPLVRLWLACRQCGCTQQ